VAKVIRLPQILAWQKRFATETLALATGERFHLAAEPVQAAVTWLDQHSLK
jgi:hypothetical protein